MEVLSPLTQDETTILQILARGGPAMAPIGRWKQPILSLESRGFLRRLDEFNFEITNSGRAAVEADMAESDSMLGKMLQKFRVA